MKKYIFILFLVLAGCTHYKDRNIMILGIDDEGNSDLQLYCRITNHQVHFVAIPRDTLVYIPDHGVWLVNLAHHFLGMTNVKKFYSDTFGYPVDDLWAVSLKNTRDIGQQLSKLPIIGKRLANRKYDERWVRDRTKVVFAYDRDLRMLAYVHMLVGWSQKAYIPPTIASKGMELVKSNSVYCDLSTSDLKRFRAILGSYPVYYHVQDGHYANAEFNYKWFKGNHVVYVAMPGSMFGPSNSPNPFIYSSTNFKGGEVVTPKIYNYLIGSYTNFVWFTNQYLAEKWKDIY